MGSGKLTNITITGSNVTIMCNNSGSVYCESCDNVTIEGITWDSCGDPNGTLAGMTFNGTSNVSLVNCTFQFSQITAVSLLQISHDISIKNCNFLSNIPANDFRFDNTVNIIRNPVPGPSSNSSITIFIFRSYFSNNNRYYGYFKYYSLNVNVTDPTIVDCNVTLSQTTFMHNRVEAGITVEVFKSIRVQIIEILVFNNSYPNGIALTLVSYEDVVNLSINSSDFSYNNGSDLLCEIVGRYSVINWCDQCIRNATDCSEQIGN